MEGQAPHVEGELLPAGRGQLGEESVELSGQEALGDPVQEAGQERLEGEEGLDGVGALTVDGLDGEIEVVGEPVRRGDDGPGEVVEAGGGEGLGLAAGAVGPEAGAAGGFVRD